MIQLSLLDTRQALAVIRFNCPHCSRLFEIAPALARLPLVCRGCGQSVTAPEKSTIPEPPPAKIEPAIPPKPVPKVQHATSAPRPAVPATPNLSPVAPDKEDERTLLFEKPDELAELEIGAHRLPAPPLEHSNRKPAAPSPIRARTGERRILALVVDVAIALVLVVAGVMLGELVAKQTTREVLREAGSAAKFPPMELLMWMSPTLIFLLGYGLLASRGRSVGGWLRRRAAA